MVLLQYQLPITYKSIFHYTLNCGTPDIALNNRTIPVEPIHQQFHPNRQLHSDFPYHMNHLLPYAAHLYVFQMIIDDEDDECQNIANKTLTKPIQSIIRLKSMRNVESIDQTKKEQMKKNVIHWRLDWIFFFEIKANRFDKTYN